MARDTNLLIGELVNSLEPVKPLSFGRGLGYALLATAVAVVAVIASLGARADLVAGRLDPVFLLAAGLFLLLGIAASVTVVVMSRPRVGSDHGGWIWAASMAALIPVSGILIAAGRGSSIFSTAQTVHGAECLACGLGAGTLVFATLVWWLRQGAPTSPERAGLLTGIASGSLGIFAFSLHCADNDIVHVGLWHSAVVVLLAAAGRVLVPRLVRW